MIDTIVFDLGGVLIAYDPANLFRKIFSNESEMEYFLNEICTQEWNAQQDAGRSVQQATQELISSYPKYKNEISAFYDRWEETLGGPITHSVETLKKIHQSKKYRLFALTNWSSETFPRAQQLFDFISLFQGIVVSGYEKTKKPDPEIFHRLISRFDINPATTIYIDDSYPNIETAIQLGFKTIHFSERENLQDQLKTLGVNHL